MSDGAEHVPETAKWLGCTVPPEGWWCSREPGHDGPCAARPETGEPGWGGLQQPVTHAEQAAADYKTLVLEATGWAYAHGKDRLENRYLLALADAVESLVAENADLVRTQCDATHTTLRELKAERDALRAQLDAMGRFDRKVAARKPGTDTWESTGTIRNDEPLARLRLRLHRDMGTDPILYQRSVKVIEGPWVEVSGNE